MPKTMYESYWSFNECHWIEFTSLWYFIAGFEKYFTKQRFVHAPRRGGEVEVADMHGRYWQKRYNGARRVSF